MILVMLDDDDLRFDSERIQNQYPWMYWKGCRQLWESSAQFSTNQKASSTRYPNPKTKSISQSLLEFLDRRNCLAETTVTTRRNLLNKRCLRWDTGFQVDHGAVEGSKSNQDQLQGVVQTTGKVLIPEENMTLSLFDHPWRQHQHKIVRDQEEAERFVLEFHLRHICWYSFSHISKAPVRTFLMGLHRRLCSQLCRADEDDVLGPWHFLPATMPGRLSAWTTLCLSPTPDFLMMLNSLRNLL